MPTAQGHAALIGDRDDVMGVNTIEEKTHQTSPADARPKEPDSFHRGKFFKGVRAQFLVVVSDDFAAEIVEIIHRRVQPNGAGDIRSAGLETMWSGFPGAVMIIDR